MEGGTTGMLPTSSTTALSAPLRRPTVVLLHGFLGDRRDMEPLQKKLAPHFNSVSVDLPGHGDSMQIGDQRHALQALTTTLDSLQPVASTRPFLLVGYSMGGRIALRFAARRPEKVAGVVVLGGSPGIDDPVALQERAVKDENLAAKFRSMSA